MHHDLDWARRLYLPELPFPKTYRVGKYTAIGPGKTRRQTLFTLEGCGVLKRFWTTAHRIELLNLAFFVDDSGTPVLSGKACEIARAAERLSCPAIPLGGFLDGRSVSLYLPIAFTKSLRIEAEPDSDVGDGPYFQIDYTLDTPERWPAIVQTTTSDGMRLSYDLPEMAPVPEPRRKIIEKEYELGQCDPVNLRIPGPGVIRRVEITTENPDILMFRAAFDEAIADPERLDGPFQVDAPLRDLVGPFVNAGVERLGTSAIIHFPMPFRREAGLQLATGLGYGAFHQKYPVKLRVEVEENPTDLERQYYFHARFATAVPNGHEDFECLSTAGRGHFVGVHLFDTGHDHGGGDNVMFDSGVPTAGQLHGICGEDYYHMAYMRTGNRTPYSGCPTHSARYRHHLELPIPFQESFVFNWGSFAGQPARAVGLWYAEKPDRREKPREMTWQINGPFRLDQMDTLQPGAPLPAQAHPWHDDQHDQPSKSAVRKAQRGFVDLCHDHRRYLWPVPPSSGYILANVCTVATTRLFSPDAKTTELLIGGDDPIRVFLNGVPVLRDEGRAGLTPFRLFVVPITLRAGINELWVVAGNTANTNWLWNGFSCRIRGEEDLGFIE